jgi:hypothetical protein
MFTPGGQLDLRNVAAFGGGKGGGGSTYTPPAPIPNTVLTDPVSGKSFTHVNDPNSPDYKEGALSASDQLNAAIAERQAGELATSNQAKADKTAADAKAESDFQTSRQGAYDNALQGVMRKFQLQGADPNQYMDTDITPALQRQYNSVRDLDPNPTAAFDPSLGDTIIGNVLSGKRTQASNSLNNIFTPTYAQNALPDSITNQYKNTILDEQFTPLQAQLENAQKRGTLVGAGYNAAQDRLKQKRTAADTNVSTLGSNILAADRSNINDYISGARNDVSHLSLADQFDPNTYSATAKGKADTFSSGFGGALRDAVGDTKFADINDLLNAGGSVQGSQNPNAANPTGAPLTATGGGPLSANYVSDEELAKKPRGLGSTGAF